MVSAGETSSQIQLCAGIPIAGCSASFPKERACGIYGLGRFRQRVPRGIEEESRWAVLTAAPALDTPVKLAAAGLF